MQNSNRRLPIRLSNTLRFTMAIFGFMCLFTIIDAPKAAADQCANVNGKFAQANVFVEIKNKNGTTVGYGRDFKFNVTATTPDPGDYPSGSERRQLAQTQKGYLLGAPQHGAIKASGGNAHPASSYSPGVPSQSVDIDTAGRMHLCDRGSGPHPAFDFTDGSNGNAILDCLGSNAVLSSNLSDRWLFTASFNFRGTGAPQNYVDNNNNPKGSIPSGGRWINNTGRLAPTRTEDANKLIGTIIFIYELPGDPAPENWELQPSTNIDKTTMAVGQTATWTHWIRNIGGTTAPSGQNYGAQRNYDNEGWRALSSNRRTPAIASGARFDITGTFRYTAQAGDEGKTFCQRSAVNKYIATSTGTAYADEKCVTISGPTADKYVTITPSLNGGGDIETGGTASFSGSANISGFPQQYTDWGYNEQARQQVAQRQPASLTTNGTQSRTQYANGTGSQIYSCTGSSSRVPGTGGPNGNDSSLKCWNQSQAASPVPAGGGHHVCPSGYEPSGRYVAVASTCYRATSPTVTTGYTCPSGYYGGGSSPSCYRTEYRCINSTAGSTTWTTSYPSCRNYYTCPENANGTGWWYSSPICDAWKCRYGDSPVFKGVAQPLCEYRCQNGLGSEAGKTPTAPGRAPLATAGSSDPNYGHRLYNSGDLNCYIQPAFNINCNWVSIRVTSSSGATRTLPNQSAGSSVVTANGSQCPSPLSVPPPLVIGDRVCVTFKVNTPTSWLGSPYLQPGKQNGVQVVRWGWQPNPVPEITSCVRVVGKPYVRVVGGDVGTGRGAAFTATPCTVGTNAGIGTHNKASGDFAGSGSGVAAIVQATISGFASGQFAASGGLGAAPKALTFANNTGVFGTAWGGAVACADASNFTILGNQSIPASLPLGEIRKVKMTGNVIINSDIKYPDYTNLTDMPLFQLVVDGNIYINGNVTQLDGIYIASGDIYTCATGSSPIEDTWRNTCNKQLVVNGAFIANKVYLGRDCGSLRYATRQGTVYESSGTDRERCNTASGSAEIFNFLPEQWIKAGTGKPSSDYDSITNMPPIL